MRSWIARLVILATCLSFGLIARSAQAQGQASDAVMQLELTGVVDPFMADYLRGAIQDANDDGSPAVLLTIDTPGGLGSSMRRDHPGDPRLERAGHLLRLAGGRPGRLGRSVRLDVVPGRGDGPGDERRRRDAGGHLGTDAAEEGHERRGGVDPEDGPDLRTQRRGRRVVRARCDEHHRDGGAGRERHRPDRAERRRAPRRRERHDRDARRRVDHDDPRPHEPRRSSSARCRPARGSCTTCSTRTSRSSSSGSGSCSS